VALGHLHRPQSLGKMHIRYCGTPLKYSFSEANDKKSLTVIDLNEKGNMNIREIPLVPLRDMREIKGMYHDLMNRKNYEGTQVEDYLRIVLTDEDEEYNAIAKLSRIYPNIMNLDYDNWKTRSRNRIDTMTQASANLSPQELFNEFFTKQTGRSMSNEQQTFVTDVVEKIWEDKQ
jgi:exonuclease SbcD